MGANTIIYHNRLTFEGKIGCPVQGNVLIRLRLNGKYAKISRFFLFRCEPPTFPTYCPFMSKKKSVPGKECWLHQMARVTRQP